MTCRKNYVINRLPPPHPELQLVVTIPAKNEEACITSCLQALASQNLQETKKNCYEVIVLINHSNDGTLQKCIDFQLKNREFPFHILVTFADNICNVGAARKLLMDIAATRLSQKNHLIAMTDADTLVSADWMATLVHYIPQPPALICGTIAVNTQQLGGFALHMFLEKERYLLYRSQLESLMLPEKHDPWPRHAANSGPNMAIKKEAYLTVGGMPQLACMEDAALHQRVVGKDLPVRHDLHLQVETSSRLESRATRGFGHELQFWSQLNDTSYIYAVEGLQKMQVRLNAFKLVKSVYLDKNRQKIEEISRFLKLPLTAIQSLFTHYPNYKAMNQRLFTVLEKNRAWQEAYPNISVLQANQQFEKFFNENKAVNFEPSSIQPVRSAAV